MTFFTPSTKKMKMINKKSLWEVKVSCVTCMRVLRGVDVIGSYHQAGHEESTWHIR